MAEELLRRPPGGGGAAQAVGPEAVDHLPQASPGGVVPLGQRAHAYPARTAASAASAPCSTERAYLWTSSGTSPIFPSM